MRHARERDPSASSQVNGGGGCGIRTREGLHPTRFPTMRTSVHRRPPPSATCANTIWVDIGERPRTGVNETETETRGQATRHGQHGRGATPGERLGDLVGAAPGPGPCRPRRAAVYCVQVRARRPSRLRRAGRLHPCQFIWPGWGHVAGPPLLRITATVIKVTEVRSQVRIAARCRPRPRYGAFPRRRRERRRYGGWRSGDRTLSCAGISSLEASRLKPASCEASLGSVWPSTLWMEFRAWRSQPARLITGTCVAGSLDR